MARDTVFAAVMIILNGIIGLCLLVGGAAHREQTFSLDGVIPGWTEGLQLMFEGEKTRFWIPEKLAYEGKKAPYGLLVFDVELIKIVQ